MSCFLTEDIVLECLAQTGENNVSGIAEWMNTTSEGKINVMTVAVSRVVKGLLAGKSGEPEIRISKIEIARRPLRGHPCRYYQLTEAGQQRVEETRALVAAVFDLS